MAKERIAKFIAATGIASRREAERLIEQRKVKVNGVIINTPVTLVDDNDQIEVDGKLLARIEEPSVWLLNKPDGYVCTRNDEMGRKTIYDLLPKEMQNVHYIGRLDISSEGLLILTDSPEVKRFYEHPSNKIPRVYLARVRGTIPPKMFEFCKKGVIVPDKETGKKMIYYAEVEKYKEPSDSGKNQWLKFTLKEGKNREIRRICEHFDLQVSRLKRISFGDFYLGDLEKGKYIEVE